MQVIRLNNSNDFQTFETHDFQTVNRYVLEIEGVWYRLEHITNPVFNPKEEQCSDNVYKWSSRGWKHSFRLRVCEPKHNVPPEVVQQFIDRHLETGCQDASLIVLDEGETYRDKEKEGWQTKPNPEGRNRSYT